MRRGTRGTQEICRNDADIVGALFIEKTDDHFVELQHT